MTKAFNNIMAGLEDALTYAEGDTSRGKSHTVEIVDVKKVRSKTKLSQDKFAKVFCIPVGTLRNWEQGHRHPDGPAMALLTIIDKEPEAALRALHG